MSTSILSCLPPVDLQLADAHKTTERSHLVAIVNNPNYSEAKVHSSLVNVDFICKCRELNFAIPLWAIF